MRPDPRHPIRPINTNIDEGIGGVKGGDDGRDELVKRKRRDGTECIENGIYAAEDITDADKTGNSEELHAEEVELARALPTPILPTQKDIDDHWLDHLQYRSWCSACVNGRGRERPHHRVPGKRKIPTLAFDYCFATKHGIYSRGEWANMPQDAIGVKILVARELVSRATFAHVVSAKGTGEDRYASDCLVQDIE